MKQARGIATITAAVMLACALSLLVGFWLKYRCTTHNWDGYQYRTSCYNDVYALYSFRGLHENPFPYVHGDGILDNETDANGNRVEIGDLEYPVATGYFIGLLAKFSRDGKTFFVLTAVGLAAATLLAVWLVLGMVTDRRRVLYFALGPSMALYVFHNWDLLAVLLLCAGLYAFSREADLAAGFALGAGAAAKVFPALVLPALMLARWRAGTRRAWSIVAMAVASFAALNLPVLFANFQGWWLPWKFQSTRFPNFESWGYMVYRHLSRHFGGFWAKTWPGLTSYLALGMWIALATMLVRAHRRDGGVRPHVLAFQLLLAFLLTGKIYSPQYALWVLPFFALVRMPWYSFVVFSITDAAVWIAISSYFLASGVGAGDPDLRLLILEICVWVRYAALAWLIWLAGRCQENVEARGALTPRTSVPALA